MRGVEQRLARLGEAMMRGPQGSGRTWRILASAPEGGLIVAWDKRHEDFLRGVVRSMGREGLQLTTDDLGNGAGMCDVIPDHFTTARLLLAAAGELQTLRAGHAEERDAGNRARLALDSLTGELQDICGQLGIVAGQDRIRFLRERLGLIKGER